MILAQVLFYCAHCSFKNSELTIRNVNINPSRIGIIKILRKMGVKIIFKNLRVYKGENLADIKIKAPNLLKQSIASKI